MKDYIHPWLISLVDLFSPSVHVLLQTYPWGCTGVLTSPKRRQEAARNTSVWPRRASRSKADNALRLVPCGTCHTTALPLSGLSSTVNTRSCNSSLPSTGQLYQRCHRPLPTASGTSHRGTLIVLNKNAVHSRGQRQPRPPGMHCQWERHCTASCPEAPANSFFFVM